MEPITHFLTGACIGRAGLNRKTAYATLAAVLAAEAADIDILWSLAGPVEELKHHRGITHTFIATPVVAGAAVGLVWLYDRWLQGRRRRRMAAASAPNERAPVEGRGFPPFPQEEAERTGHGALNQSVRAPSTPASAVPGAPGQMLQQPVHWGWLYATALISALSHLLLDWTNNYGLRPFFPFNPRWYAGSFVFIAEPVLWAVFLLALVLPWLLGLADREIGARRQAFRGRGWAIFALTAMVVLWGWRWSEHARARALLDNVQITTAPVLRIGLEPYPVNPFHWHAIVETGEYYQTAEVDTRTGSIDSDQRRDVVFKPTATAATEAAKRTPLGQVYLDWGTWAVVRDIGPVAAPGLAPPQMAANRQWTTVEFDDLRWDYSYLGAGRATIRNPLAGWVYIVDGRDDAGKR